MDMMISLRGELEQLPYLPEIAAMGAGIELGSYGLIGIRSLQEWQQRVRMHQTLREQFDGTLAIHGPFVGMDFAHMDHLIRASIQQRMDMTFAAATQLRASRVVLHSGFTLEVDVFQYRDAWRNSSIAYWQQEITRWADAGIGIVLENDLDAVPDLLLEITDAVDNPFLGLCLDIGHHHLFANSDVREWVWQMRHKLVHVHLHDNDGTRDQHWPLGRGTIDFTHIFAALQKHVPDATLSIEVEDEIEVKMGELHKVAAHFATH